MTTTKGIRGGSRKNAGRKPLVEGSQTVVLTIRMAETQKDKLGKLATHEGVTEAEWIRKRIDRAKEPK